MALLSGAIVKVHTAKGHLVCWFTPPPHGPYRKALSPLSDNGEVQSRPLARRRAAPFRRRPGNKTGFPGKAGRVAGRFRTGKRPAPPRTAPCDAPPDPPFHTPPPHPPFATRHPPQKRLARF